MVNCFKQLKKVETQYLKIIEALKRYAFKHYTVDLSSAFRRKDAKMPKSEILEKPTAEEVEVNPTLEYVYQVQLKEYVKEERMLKVALRSIWAVIWGQCSSSICTKLDKCKHIKELKRKANIVELLKYISNKRACYANISHHFIFIIRKRGYQFKNTYKFSKLW